MFTSRDSLYFEFCYNLARKASARILAATSPYAYDAGSLHYLNDDGTAGFVIHPNGELTNVFSTRRGQGDNVMTAALAAGATNLDCFDGYLVEFYTRHGFEIVRREANWTAGDPDVVFMALPAGTEFAR